MNARGDIPEEVKEQAAEEYAAGDEGLSVVASRYGMSRYTLSMYLREHIRKYRQGLAADELEALRAVLKILEDQPPEICQRVLAYAANYKGVSP